METNKDPDLDKYFRKILFTIFFGLLWLMAGITAGIFYQMAFFNVVPLIYNILFYAVMVLTLVLLIRYYIKLWK